jgi:hypothetical protein
MRKTQAIREKIALDISNLAFFNKVYSVKRTNIPDSSLPAVTVTTGTGDYGNGATETSILIRVEIKDKGAKVEDILDSHAERVEPLFPVGSTLGGLVEYMNPVSFDYALDDDSATGVIGLNFEINYEV